MRKRYTASAEKVLENAGKEAVSRGMSYVGTEHLLLALIKTKGVAAEVLRENAVNAESLEEMIQEMDKSAAGVLTKEKGDFTPRVLQSDRAERAGGRALRNGTCRNRAFADRTVKRNGVYCSPFAGNGWDQPAEIVYGFVDRSRTGYEYCEK